MWNFKHRIQAFLCVKLSMAGCLKNAQHKALCKVVSKIQKVLSNLSELRFISFCVGAKANCLFTVRPQVISSFPFIMSLFKIFAGIISLGRQGAPIGFIGHL